MDETLIHSFCRRELGYPSDAIDVKVVNLLEAENFEPKFLKIVRLSLSSLPIRSLIANIVH